MQYTYYKETVVVSPLSALTNREQNKRGGRFPFPLSLSHSLAPHRQSLFFTFPNKLTNHNLFPLIHFHSMQPL